MGLLAADKRKIPKKQGKKSPANKGASLESLSILLESVTDTMIVRCMHKYAKYAFTGGLFTCCPEPKNLQDTWAASPLKAESAVTKS